MPDAAIPGPVSRPNELSVSAPGPQIVVVPAAARHTVWWVLTVVLAALTTAIVLRWDEASMVRSALAQAAGGSTGAPLAGARGIYAFTGQLTSKSYGLFMLDVDTGTIWCYEMQRGGNGEPQMKLVAARNWIWDRYLEEFNVSDPVPSAVQQLVQQQRQAQRSAVGPASAPAAAGEQ